MTAKSIRLAGIHLRGIKYQFTMSPTVLQTETSDVIRAGKGAMKQGLSHAVEEALHNSGNYRRSAQRVGWGDARETKGNKVSSPEELDAIRKIDEKSVFAIRHTTVPSTRQTDNVLNRL